MNFWTELCFLRTMHFNAGFRSFVGSFESPPPRIIMFFRMEANNSKIADIHGLFCQKFLRCLLCFKKVGVLTRREANFAAQRNFVSFSSRNMIKVTFRMKAKSSKLQKFEHNFVVVNQNFFDFL